MKTLKLLKYLLLIAFGTTLFFSCSKDEAEENELKTIETTIEKRAPDCEVEICVVITDNTTGNGYQDIYIAEIPGYGDIVIQSGFVNLPGQAPFPLAPNGEFCAFIPIMGSATATLNFKGYGAAVVTATWDNGTSCEIFSVGVGTNAGMSDTQDITLECDPICAPATCIVKICAEITPNTTGNNYPDIYIVTLPNNAGQIIIQNGIVNIPGVPPFPLDPSGVFCAELDVPVGGSLTANLAFKGYGSVETTGYWDNGTDCLLFSVGVGTQSGQSDEQDITLTCDPPC